MVAWAASTSTCDVRLGCADVVEAALTQHSSAALIVGLDQLRAIRKYHSSPVRMQRCVPVLSPSRVVGKKTRLTPAAFL